MTKIKLMLAVACFAGTALASDVVLNIKLNGLEIENASKVARILTHGFLVIEDINADTNVYAGALYMVDRKWNRNKWDHDKDDHLVKGRRKKSLGYEKEPVDVRLVSNHHHQFGILVDMENAQFAGIGQSKIAGNGEIMQVVVSSGHGAFISSVYTEDDLVYTNQVPAAAASTNVLEEIAVGKMSARLNKALTDLSEGTNGTYRVEQWLENAGYENRDAE